MTELACAFHGDTHRAGVCQGTATTFFRTAKGTMWPLCPGCCERHKVIAVGIIERGKLPAELVNSAVFDIPIDDESLARFRAQDPNRIQATFDKADAATLNTLCDLKPV